MRFKVGDRVRVVKRAEMSNMKLKDKYIGEVFTILECFENLTYSYALGNRVYWCDEELELVKFTKSNLKDGMVVEYRDGDRRMVLGDKLIGNIYWGSLTDYNEELEYNVLDSNDFALMIDKIFKSNAVNLEEYFDDDKLELIWERNKEEEPAKKMTVVEIEKELGYKVEVVSND